MNSPFLHARDISKAYGGVQALAGVSLDIRPGEVHALVGENGAGKSTLIKVLCGVVAPDGGEVSVEGKPVAPGSVAAAEAMGIAVIHQESTAFAHLGAIDNIFIGREPRRAGGLLLDRRQMKSQTQALLERLGEEFDIEAPVGGLSVAQRQMIGIARALSRRSRLLIMDEPTASLSERETKVLFRVIRQLQDEGVGILYVSHRLEEIFALADRVSVLRDGRWVETRDIGDITRDQLIQLMVGRAVESMEESPSVAIGEEVLKVENLSRQGAFREVSFAVRAGEIVGLAGLVGAGRSEVARAIFGIDTPDAGSVFMGGKSLSGGDVRTAMARGVALVPEDRQHLGLVLPMSIGTNFVLPVLKTLSRGAFRSSPAEAQLIERLMRELAVRAPNAGVPAQSLSGGNQQKIVLGKWLATDPRLLILDEPTRGVDVGAKAEVYRLIRDLAARGMATLLISSDLPEVLSLSHRILVMREGQISGELSREAATSEKILALALPDAAAA